MATIVRPATDADAELLSALNADVQALHAAVLPWRFKPPGPATFPPEAAIALMAKPENRIAIADVDGVAAGYVYWEIQRRPETAFHFAHEAIYLHHLSVRPAFRARGVGSALVAAVRASAAEHGIDTVVLDIWSFNDTARTFFRRHGFTCFGERMWLR